MSRLGNGCRLWVLAYAVVVCALATAVASTGYWTLSGHCCGIYVPIIAADDPERCFPVQDKDDFWLVVWLRRGHCDPDTWHRVYP